MSSFEFDTDRFDELAVAEAMGTLLPAEKSEFHALLHVAPAEAREQWRRHRVTALHLNAVTEPQAPPKSVWYAIRREVESKIEARKARRSSAFTDPFIDKIIHLLGLHKPNIALAISVVKLALIVVLGIWTSQLQRGQTVAERELTLLRTEVDYQRELLAILQAPTINVVNMAGTESNPSGFGKVITDPEHRKALLQIANLPTIDASKDYQLWIIVGDKPVSTGLFSVEETDDHFFRIDDLAETDMSRISAFAVTLEPKGGMSAPTGPMVLLGAVR